MTGVYGDPFPPPPRTVGELGLCGSPADAYTHRAGAPTVHDLPPARPYETSAGRGVNAPRDRAGSHPAGTEATPGRLRPGLHSFARRRGCAPTSGTHPEAT